MAGYKFGQKIKRGMNAGEHPASYTDFNAPPDQSPWAHEASQPWHTKLSKWLSGNYDDAKDSVVEGYTDTKDSVIEGYDDAKDFVSEGYDKMVKKGGEWLDYDSDTVDTEESFGDPFEWEDNPSRMKNKLNFDQINERVAERVAMNNALLTPARADSHDTPGKKVDESDYSYLDNEELGPDKSERRGKIINEMLDDKMAERFGPDAMEGGEKIDQTSWWDSISDSMESSGKGKGVSSNQKIAANLIKDIFAEPEQAPQQQIGASPLTPGKNFDMSYLKNKRPKRERYRNLGLLA